MGKGIAEILAGVGFIAVSTCALYYTAFASLGLIWDGCGNIVQSRKK